MNITDLHVPLILVGTIVLASVKIALSLGKFKQSINSDMQGLKYANEAQNKDITDLREDLEYLTNALDKKIEHRDSRLSSSISQIQNYLEKHGTFIRRDQLYDGVKNQKP